MIWLLEGAVLSQVECSEYLDGQRNERIEGMFGMDIVMQLSANGKRIWIKEWRAAII